MTSSDRPPPPSPRPLRVLLISPVPRVDPPSGDVTYTQQLLAHPPPGVVYTTYDAAIADGSLTELGTRQAVAAVGGRERGVQLGLAALRVVESRVRRSGWAFRERVRLFRVDPGRYDLVHVHVFHHRLVGAHPPVVVSAGGPLRWLYQDAWGWSRTRASVADLLDRLWGRCYGATMCASRLGGADLFIAPSEDLAAALLRAGWPPARVAVQPNYLSSEGAAPRGPLREPVTLGFVARDFTAKGGAEVLAAFARLRESRPSLRLRITGPGKSPFAAGAEPEGVTFDGEVDRARLLDEILPTIDLFVYPSHFDTGVPYTSMEALSRAIPAVVSDYRSLPDLVGPDAGKVCRTHDAGSLAAAVEELLDPVAYAAASVAASRRFAARFASSSQAPRLRDLYDSVRGRERPV